MYSINFFVYPITPPNRSATHSLTPSFTIKLQSANIKSAILQKIR